MLLSMVSSMTPSIPNLFIALFKDLVSLFFPDLTSMAVTLPFMVVTKSSSILSLPCSET